MEEEDSRCDHLRVWSKESLAKTSRCSLALLVKREVGCALVTVALCCSKVHEVALSLACLESEVLSR